MPRRIAILVAAAGLAATFLPLSAGVATAMPVPLAPVAQPMAQSFFWQWEDGGTAKARTFRESTYGSAVGIPQIVVSAVPARPSQYVKLQYKQDGKWRREDADTTDDSGKAYLSLDPYCSNNTWCGGTYKYRLLVNGNYTVLTIKYVDD